MLQTDVDVLIVGAGLAGIGFAHHLQNACPEKSFLLLEARSAIGGTWDLFRYPGVRSDSDMYVYGYSFKPWRDDRAIAPGDTIVEYIREAAAESGIDQHIQFGQSVQSAQWRSDTGQWSVSAVDAESGEQKKITCNWLQLCSGYYSYNKGYTPVFSGIDNFRGQVVHPQAWPENLELRDKRIVVIGSGATAVTLVPSLACAAMQVVMLQRTPSFILAMPSIDRFATAVRCLLPAQLAHRLIRRRNSRIEDTEYVHTRKEPALVRVEFLEETRKRLPDGFDVEKHFLPDYDPWDQRVCVSPDGDFFDAICDNRASVVTDEIASFSETAIQLKSGDSLEADIIVTATGLNMEVGGGIDFIVDDKSISLADLHLYRGNMFSGVPNLSLSMGTFTASYTPRIELVAKYVCRLMQYLDKHNLVAATPVLPASEKEQTARPYIEGFSAGYVERALARLPKQGAAHPWLNVQTFQENKQLLNEVINDNVLQFSDRQLSK